MSNMLTWLCLVALVSVIVGEESNEDDSFTCDSDSAAQASFLCPTEALLLNGLGSRSPFFGDSLSPKCYDFKQKVYGDEMSNYLFFSPDGGFSLSAECPQENEIIVAYNLCLEDDHVIVIGLECAPLLDPDTVEQVYNATSDEFKHSLVSCGDASAMRGLHLMDSGDGILTRVIMTCVQLYVEEMWPVEV